MVDGLRQLGQLTAGGATVRRLVQSTAATSDKIEPLNRRLSEVPVTQVDAGTASDFHYLAGLAARVVEAVAGHHRGILKDFADRDLPEAAVDLFQRLGLKVPKPRTRAVAGHTAPHPTTREELERELGRRIISPVKELEQD